ncbi:MAG: DUF2680 domain-containing protein [Peptococcaceae bacterium]|nr:DUF2680 domain-containing protein [Peptococcaceae bacterium]
MKKIKKILAATVITVLGISGAVYAVEIRTPADIAAALTGKSITEVNQERADGKTYGTIAKEAGKLDEFKAEMLEQKKAILDERVKEGTLTQQQADQILARIQNNQANCDATGNAGIGQRNGAGFGLGKGMGSCNGTGFGQGMGAGRGLNR